MCLLGLVSPNPNGGMAPKGDHGGFSFPAQTGRKMFESEEQFRTLVLQKTPDEVLAAVGKPDFVHQAGRFTNGDTYDESWVYERRLIHKATGHKQTLQVFFQDGRAMETGVK